MAEPASQEPAALTAVRQGSGHAADLALAPSRRGGRWRVALDGFRGDSLSRQSSLLVIDYLIIGAIGGVCTIIAAHAWTALRNRVFGALGGVMSLLSTMTNTGLASTITRFLSQEDNQLDFIIEATVVSLFTGVGLCAAICFVPGHFGVPLNDLPGTIGVAFALFAGYVVANNLTAITDPAFVARKEVSYAVVKDISASVLRIPILILFIGTNAVGLLSSYVAYTALAGVLDVALVLWKLRNRGPKQSLVRLSLLRKRWRFTLTSHSAALVSTAPAALVATIAAAFDGPTRAAEITIPLTVAAYMSVIPSMTSQALLAELGDESRDVGNIAVRAMRLCYAGMVPAALLLILLAPQVLLIFGHRYSASSAGYLRWDALAAVLSVSNYVSDTVLLAREKMLAYNLVNGLGAVAALGCSLAAGLLGPFWFGPAPVAGQLIYLTLSVTALLVYTTPAEMVAAFKTVRWRP